MILAGAISGYIQEVVTCTENGHIINKTEVSMQYTSVLFVACYV